MSLKVMQVRWVIRIPSRALRGAMALLFFMLHAPELGSESISLTTYYPAPSGIYAKLVTTGDAYLASAAGSVGIGLTDPVQKLDVSGSARANTYYVDSGAAYLKASGLAGANGLTNGAAFFTNGAEQMTIASGGQIGIGKNPTEWATAGSFLKLDVKGTIRLRQTGCAVYMFNAAIQSCAASGSGNKIEPAPGVNDCTAGCYATAQGGIWSATEAAVKSPPITYETQPMVCCPCGAGGCPSN